MDGKTPLIFIKECVMYILILNKEGHMFARDHITTDIDIATKFESEFDAMEIVAILQHAYPEWELKEI